MRLKSAIVDYLQNQKRISEKFYIPDNVIVRSDGNPKDEIINEEKIKEITAVIPDKKLEEDIIKNKLDDSWKNSIDLNTLYDKIHNCLQCELGNTRTNFVFGSGNPNADILIIGEAPGKDEDEQGLPFVGRAGQLLTKIIESIDIKRDDVYIANICKCRPPNNRAPLKEEVSSCLPFLLKQIELIKPAFILALGATAVYSLTGEKPIMSEARGKLTEFHGVPMMITYHPAALLYNPNLKRDVWEDMKLLKQIYENYKSTN